MGSVRAGMVSVVFPGQGSQHAGMGESLNSGVRSSAAVFREADEALGFSISELCFKGPAEELEATENCQPAILAVSYACWAALKEYCPGLRVNMFAGHSLGEFTALAAAGSLSFSEAIRLVRKRGLLMSEAGGGIDGSMCAVLGMAGEKLAEICEGSGVCMANINCPGQVVLSGKREDIEGIMPEIAKAGGRPVRLRVAGAFHSPYMAAAAERFAAELEKVEFRPPEAPVLSNVTAGFHGGPEDIRKKLAEQVRRPVLWEDIVLRMACEGSETFIEAGPGRVLTKLILRTCPDLRACSVEDRETLEGTAELLEGLEK